jgi:hypothetical protein
MIHPKERIQHLRHGKRSKSRKNFYILLGYKILRGILSSLPTRCSVIQFFFIATNALHVSGSFSAHHQRLETVHTASGICQACLLLPLVWVTPNSPTLAVAASKLDITNGVCTVLNSWWWAEKLPETCRALVAIKKNCITLDLVGILERIH